MLHSPAYRQRYADYLKSDFARVPLPVSRALFEDLVPLGTGLVALHLLDSKALPSLVDPKTVRLAGHGEARIVHAPTFDVKLGRVTINANRWFETVPETTWNFHVGGYQPAQKWLKATPNNKRIFCQAPHFVMARLVRATFRGMCGNRWPGQAVP